jgi:hypothetical protein
MSRTRIVARENLRTAVWVLLITLSGGVAACRAGRGEGSAIEGEWGVQLSTTEVRGVAVARTAEGVLVLNNSLRRYPDDPRGEVGGVVGRRYIDLESILRTPSSGQPGSKRFLAIPGADRYETVHARIGQHSHVVMDLAPHLKDASPTLRGVVAGDTIRGAWSIMAEGDTTARGTFVMWRTSIPWALDSAQRRSNRSVGAGN